MKDNYEFWLCFVATVLLSAFVYGIMFFVPKDYILLFVLYSTIMVVGGTLVRHFIGKL